ncbi:MAG: class I SAM-dependent methyltransferase [Alistipes sp.]|nr:class I SAM-dependent methyltransferase [Alistipes sp.]
MENENNSIHPFEFDLICNFFKRLHRQGPGSPEATRLAAGFIGPLGPDAEIADLGCGTGGQTLTLARSFEGTITGIDLFPGFIDIFNRNMVREGLSDRVRGIVGSMDDLPFGEGTLDLIWSEGAIYNIGFGNGLRLWNRYLRPGGYVAVTEAAWLTPERPGEIQRFWDENYPRIDTIGNQLREMEEAGYQVVAHFILPEECWRENYFHPHRAAHESFLKEYPGNQAAEDFIGMQKHEQELYEKYHEYYGYVFYIGRKL